MRNIFKLTLTVVILMIASTSFLEAQSWKKNLKKLAETATSSSTNSGGDFASSQDALIMQTSAALATLSEAQYYVALAQGNQELAEQLKNISDALKGGDNSDIKGHVNTINKAAKAQKEIINKKEKMSDEAKKYYQSSLIPFFTSAALTVKLKEPAEQFVKGAINEIKSIRNPLELGKLKKTLATGIFVGKNIPSLIKNILGTTGDLMSYSKDNGLDVSKAKSIEL